MLQTLVDALYWLTLATWFGTVLVSAVMPPIIHKAIRDANPTLPLVLSVNLDKQHSTLLSGQVIGALMSTLFRIEGVCAGVFLPVLVGKWLLTVTRTADAIIPLLITALYVGAAGFLLYGWRVVWPKALAHRTKYIENADDPDIANAELDELDRYGAELFAITRNMLFALLGMVLFSAALLQQAQRLIIE